MSEEARPGEFRPLGQREFKPNQVPGPQGPVKITNPGFVDSKPVMAESDFALGSSGPLPVHCAACGGEIRKLRPGSKPFREGPYKGGYICTDCLVLSLAEDPSAQGSILEEARKIRARRAQWKKEVLFEDPDGKVWLTERGTFLVEIRKLPFGGEMEFDPGRLELFLRAFRAVGAKMGMGDVEGKGPVAGPEYEVWLSRNGSPPVQHVDGFGRRMRTPDRKMAEDTARDILERGDAKGAYVLKCDTVLELEVDEEGEVPEAPKPVA